MATRYIEYGDYAPWILLLGVVILALAVFLGMYHLTDYPAAIALGALGIVFVGGGAVLSAWDPVKVITDEEEQN